MSSVQGVGRREGKRALGEADAHLPETLWVSVLQQHVYSATEAKNCFILRTAR